MSAVARVATAALAVLLLASCAGPNPSSPAAADQVGNLEARLRGVGSAATGKVIVVDNGQGVTLTLDAANLQQGNYRLAFHASPNCSSPNGESSGPVWAPPDSAGPAGELIPGIYVGQREMVSFAARIPGVHVDREPSLRGRSIVLHRGNFVDSPLPGSPNNYIACGVFENLTPGPLQMLVR
jgi:Cu/Zn superoxide dismutase